MSEAVQSSSRRRAWVSVVALVIIVAVIGGLSWQLDQPVRVQHPETGFKFPRPDQITKLTFDGFYYPETDTYLTGEVAKEHWQELLNAMQPSELDPEPVTWEVMCKITIQTTDGQRIGITFANMKSDGAFYAGELPWGPDRTYFLGGNSAQLKAVLLQSSPSPRKAASQS